MESQESHRKVREMLKLIPSDIDVCLEDLAEIFKGQIIVEDPKCENCGTIYNLKSGMPETCWTCGMPTGEKINEMGHKPPVAHTG